MTEYPYHHMIFNGLNEVIFQANEDFDWMNFVRSIVYYSEMDDPKKAIEAIRTFLAKYQPRNEEK